jgi:hypothetical protein
MYNPDNTKGFDNHPPFIPGLELAEGFFHEDVKPVLEAHFPGLRYSAALIGNGSEVLGFDTAMSMDHHWGPRVMLFLTPQDFEAKREAIREILSRELPAVYRGFSTNFSEPDPADNGVQMLRPALAGPINHRVETYTLAGFFRSYLNIQVESELEPADWLTLPQQKLRSVTAGKIFKDDLGLEKIRSGLSWYPHDVWLYLLAAAWTRIGEEEHLMGRAGEAADEIGSALIGSRLVRDIMRLAFLMERVFAPYAKWFGTAFSRLKSAAELDPVLKTALQAVTWQEREKALCAAYRIAAEIHNSLGITAKLSAETTQFWSRPFQIIRGERFARALVQNIRDPRILPLTDRSILGSLDLISDNTELLMDEKFRPALRELYSPEQK